MPSRSSLAFISIFAVTSFAGAPCLKAQYLYPDGSIRNSYGVIQSGPNPSRMLAPNNLPTNQRYLYPDGSIRSGTGVIINGPNPSRTLPTWDGSY